MAEGLNRVMLLGNLGADPELRFTQSGQAILHLRLATTESFLDKDKVRRERTDWHSVVVWGKRGEALGKILTKGSSIFVEGRIQTSSYDDREGVKRYKTEIVASNIILAGGRGGGAGAGRGAPMGDDEGGYPAPAEEGRPSGGYPPRGGGGGGGGGGYPRSGGGGGDYPRGGGAGRPAPAREDRPAPAGRGAPPPAQEAPVDDYEGGGGFGGDDDIPF